MYVIKPNCGQNELNSYQSCIIDLQKQVVVNVSLEWSELLDQIKSELFTFL